MQENLAAQYLAKTRKLQCCLEEAEERAETAESALNKVRSRSRAGVSTGGVGRTTSREVSRPLSPLHHRYYSLNSLSPNSTRYLDNNSRLSSYYWLELLYAIPLCFLEVLFSFSCGKSFVIIIRGSSCREILSALPASELRHFQTPPEILTITPDSRAIIDPIFCLSYLSVFLMFSFLSPVPRLLWFFQILLVGRHVKIYYRFYPCQCFVNSNWISFKLCEKGFL